MQEDPLAEAKVALGDGRLGVAQRLLAERLAAAPDDAEAKELLRSAVVLDALPGRAPDPSAPPAWSGDAPVARRARTPVGVAILGAIEIVGGCAFLLLGLGALFVALGIVSLLLFAVGAAMVASGLGLMRLRPWAWWLAIWTSGIGALVDLLQVTRGASLLRLAVDVVVFVYLLAVRAHFRPHEA